MAVPTHRFTLSTTIVEQLNEFARSNIDSKRRSEIEALWERFVNDNETAIANERKRLTALGYQGDLNTKMFFKQKHIGTLSNLYIPFESVKSVRTNS